MVSVKLWESWFGHLFSCVRISFAALGFIQVLMEFVIGGLNRDDMEWVMARATQKWVLVHENLYTHTPSQAVESSKPTYSDLCASGL